MSGRPYIPAAEVRHADDEVTFAVTFKWARPWAMDHCEVGVISGELRRAILAHFRDYDQLAALAGVETWEPNEERHIGKHGYPVALEGAS